MHESAVVLGFDYGERRIGVAVGNALTRDARPLTQIEAANGALRWQLLADLIHQWQPQQLVVGVPRHPDGTAHQMTARCERFARQLNGRHGLPVDCVDERYSSVEAATWLRDTEDQAMPLGNSPRRKRTGSSLALRSSRASQPSLDAAAAAVILQQWFEERRVCRATEFAVASVVEDVEGVAPRGLP